MILNYKYKIDTQMNKNIQNIILNYNTNKKLKLLNELLHKTQDIYKYLDDIKNSNDWRIGGFYIKNNNDWRIGGFYHDEHRYFLLPKLENDI